MYFTGHGVPLAADIAVSSMMKKDQERYPERREELLDLLGVDPSWRMHQVREGRSEKKHLPDEYEYFEPWRRNFLQVFTSRFSMRISTLGAPEGHSIYLFTTAPTKSTSETKPEGQHLICFLCSRTFGNSGKDLNLFWLNYPQF